MFFATQHWHGYSHINYVVASVLGKSAKPEAKSSIFSNVSWQQDDPMAFKEQSRDQTTFGKHRFFFPPQNYSLLINALWFPWHPFRSHEGSPGSAGNRYKKRNGEVVWTWAICWILACVFVPLSRFISRSELLCYLICISVLKPHLLCVLRGNFLFYKHTYLSSWGVLLRTSIIQPALPHAFQSEQMSFNQLFSAHE